MKQLFKISLIAFLFVYIIPNVTYAREPIDGGSTPGGTVTYTIGLNKATYSTGELMDVSLASVIGLCFNNYRYSFTGGIYNSSNVLQSGTAISGEGDVGDGTPTYNNFVAWPSMTAGDFTLKLTIRTYTDWTGNVYTTSTVSKAVTFTQATVTPPPVVVTPEALSIEVFAETANVPAANPLNLKTTNNTINILVRPKNKGVNSCAWSGGGKSGKYESFIEKDSLTTIGFVSGVSLTTTFDVSCSDDVVSTPPPAGSSTACYEGRWEDGDIIHEPYGTITYTTPEGAIDEITGIVRPAFIEIVYKTGTTVRATGVDPVACP